METFTWTAQFRNRVRLLAGIEEQELDNDTLDILANLSAEWFQENTGTTFTLNDNNTSDRDELLIRMDERIKTIRTRS